MKKKIEQILNGKFEYEQPELLFSKDRLEITLEAGSTAQGELYFGTENNDRIQGYVTSSNRRFVPGSSRFSGTTVRMPYPRFLKWPILYGVQPQRPEAGRQHREAGRSNFDL